MRESCQVKFIIPFHFWDRERFRFDSNGYDTRLSRARRASRVT
jgi:hypothetical protein